MNPLNLLLLSVLIVQSSAQEDKPLNFTQLAAKYGRQSEHFDVVTEDGYILTLFHLKGEGKKPVLLMHGLCDSAETFVLRGNSSIAMTLADEGYDIWAGNSRGNQYSRRHVSLSPDRNAKQFWNFSFHEMGTYDLPAMIDFILHKTGKKKLSVVGHSQGTTIFYVLGSSRPEYNDKVSVFIALAPVAYLNDMPPGLGDSIIKAWPELDPFLKWLGLEEEFEKNGVFDWVSQLICHGMLGYNICERGVVASAIGDDSKRLEPGFFKVALHHFLKGTSRKNLNHFVQVSNRRRFAQYDYGLLNVDHYSHNKEVPLEYPPEYNLTRVTMPVALILGEHDKVSLVSNVKILMRKLPNVVYYHVIEEFNHADFVWANDLQKTLIPIMKELLVRFA